MAKESPKTVAPQLSQKELTQANLKSLEAKTLAKLDRIKTWPKEHRDAATQRTQAKLNQIREAMTQVVKPNQ